MNKAVEQERHWACKYLGDGLGDGPKCYTLQSHQSCTYHQRGELSGWRQGQPVCQATGLDEPERLISTTVAWVNRVTELV